MLDSNPLVALRSPLVWGAPIAGLIAGAALWLLVGGPEAPAKVLAMLSASERPSAEAAAGSEQTSASVAVLASRPLFAEGAAVLPRVALIGVSRMSGRAAALVSLGGAEPTWIRAGETVQGLTLVSVRSTGAMFDSVNGPLTVPLGETVEGASTPTSPQGAPADGGPPPGVKLPPEPAAAPRP